MYIGTKLDIKTGNTIARYLRIARGDSADSKYIISFSYPKDLYDKNIDGTGNSAYEARGKVLVTLKGRLSFSIDNDYIPQVTANSDSRVRELLDSNVNAIVKRHIGTICKMLKDHMK